MRFLVKFSYICNNAGQKLTMGTYMKVGILYDLKYKTEYIKS